MDAYLVGTSMTNEESGLVTVTSEKEEWGAEAWPSHKLAAWGIGEEDVE